jgi:fatty acid/phospholipid biosynthesis enzyme
VFDYEKLGGSPLLGVKGTVIITHGRARRRMISYAIEVGAAAARARIPERIAETLRGPAMAEAAPTGDVAPSADEDAPSEAAS